MLEDGKMHWLFVFYLSLILDMSWKMAAVHFYSKEMECCWGMQLLLL